MMTIGQLIDALPNDDIEVQFGFCGAFPLLDLGSSRCHYERAALDWSVRRRRDPEDKGRNPPTSKELRAYLLSRIGKKMSGYKGGEYTIGRDTLMHVDGHGECTSTTIEAVDVRSYVVVIHTIGEP